MGGVIAFGVAVGLHPTATTVKMIARAISLNIVLHMPVSKAWLLTAIVALSRSITGSD